MRGRITALDWRKKNELGRNGRAESTGQAVGERSRNAYFKVRQGISRTNEGGLDEYGSRMAAVYCTVRSRPVLVTGAVA